MSDYELILESIKISLIEQKSLLILKTKYHVDDVLKIQ